MPVVPKTVSGSRRQSGWIRDDVHRKAETSQRPQMVMCSTQPSSLTRLRFSPAKGHSCCQHTVENGQHLVRDRHDRAFRSSSHCQSPEARFEYRTPLASCRPRTLNECSPQVRIAVCGVTALLDACALTLAWTQSSPTRQLLSSRKRNQVGTGLR